jgi:hypothetical protein
VKLANFIRFITLAKHHPQKQNLSDHVKFIQFPDRCLKYFSMRSIAKPCERHRAQSKQAANEAEKWKLARTHSGRKLISKHSATDCHAGGSLSSVSLRRRQSGHIRAADKRGS